MSLWTLCFLLDWRDVIKPVCLIEPNQAACFHDLNAWLARAHAWEVRSHISSHVFVECAAEVST